MGIYRCFLAIDDFSCRNTQLKTNAKLFLWQKKKKSSWQAWSVCSAPLSFERRHQSAWTLRYATVVISIVFAVISAANFYSKYKHKLLDFALIGLIRHRYSAHNSAYSNTRECTSADSSKGYRPMTSVCCDRRVRSDTLAWLTFSRRHCGLWNHAYHRPWLGYFSGR